MKTILITMLLSISTLFSNSHDVTTLPAWGPYAKHYAGISRISDMQSGLRVDFSLMPGMYRRNVCVPNLLFESGCHPWYVSPDMKTITYRYELEWKDKVYIDATYHVLDDNRVLLEIHCVNDTDYPQDITLHTVASLGSAEQYPQFSTSSRFISGVRYVSYEPAVRKHNYNLVYDGWFRGEARDAETLTGSVLRTAGDPGDTVIYDTDGYKGPVCIRYKVSDSPVEVDVNGSSICLSSKEWCIMPIGTSQGKVSICTKSKGQVTIDALLLDGNPEVKETPLNRMPEVEMSTGSYMVKYDSDALWYGAGWTFPDSDVIQYLTSNPDIFIRRMVHNHVDTYIKDDCKGHYISAFQRPVCLKARKDTTIYNLLACGDRTFVRKELISFQNNEKYYVSQSLNQSQEKSKGMLLPGADKYGFGQQMIQATLLTNIVYPVYTQGEYIRHFTPGKNWNSLYTWDSGFICWALADLDPVKSFEIIRAYTTEAESQSAFIHHGTPLPIHFMAFSHLIGKTGDFSQLEFLYPRLKRFYSYMAGHDSSSTTLMKSGLIRTWDYFYNSGGWDDYPPQHNLRSHKDKYATTAPMVSTSFYIRAAKIMRLCAQRLGLKDDVKMYDKDIASMSKAIQDNAWDAENGYFGYVTHDAEGRPDGLYKYNGTVNFNMGLDGVSPLVAGICNQEQQDRLVDHIFDPERLWTKVGISTVDQSAPYYSHSGYWNGCVWMPHQLVLWKTMLDLGRPEMAEKIAQKALDTWAYETAQTYQCYEHFMVESGRGKGWHNFSGLSSPMVNWFTTYYVAGNVTTGFDTMIWNPQFSADLDSYSAELSFDKDCEGQLKSIVICMNPTHEYKVTAGGKEIAHDSPRPGLIYVNVKASRKPVSIKVSVR